MKQDKSKVNIKLEQNVIKNLYEILDFTEKEAKAIRNILNKGRETKLYWWGISKKNDRKTISKISIAS